MKTVRVDVKAQGDRDLKILWNDEQPWPAYCVLRTAVDGAARRIRAALAALVDAALEGKLAVKPELVKDLARAGASLYETLFAATERADVARRIRRYYEKSEPLYLRFSVETSVFVPWGLVYPASAEEVEALPLLDDVKQPGVYDRFWCLSRQLSTVYDRIPPDAAGRGLNSAGLKIMRVLNREAWETASQRLAAAAERDFLVWLDKVAPAIITSKDLRQAWRTHGATTGLLYVYCHANATKLALSEEEKIESADLLVTLSSVARAPETSGCLLIINGCSTAVGDPKGDFMAAASQEGLCGFVGSETDVPDLFALRFSAALLDLLFREQVSLGEAMLRLYRGHFPLSLVYGIYAHPDFRMPQDGLPVGNATANFCASEVGSGRLGAPPWL